MKVPNSAEHLDEYFLSHVRRVSAVVQHSRKERVNGLVIVRNQPGKGFFRACLKFRDQCGFL
jgi:hypothetical protein